MSHAQILCLVLLVVSGGCVAGPLGGSTGQEGPVTVVMNNSANQTHSFEVWVVEYPANVTVRRETGGDYVDDIGPGLSTREPGEHHDMTAIEFPSSARLRGRYELRSGDENRSQITDFSDDFAVVIVIYQGDYVASYISAHCGGDLVFVDVTMFEYGSGSAYNCEEGAF